MATRISHMGTAEWLTLVILSVAWGGSFFFVELIVGHLPPLTVSALRVVLAALALLVAMRARGLTLAVGAGVWRSFFVMGLVNNAIPFSLIVWGQAHISGSLASILNATAPIFVVIVAHLFTDDEKLNPGKIAGVLLGFLGVAWMLGSDAREGLGGEVLGQLAILGAALAYACSGIYGRRFARLGVAPLQTATAQLCASSLILLPLALLVDRPWTLALPPTEAWLAVAALALVSTSLAYILYFRLLERAGATNVLLVTFLIPVSAILLGTLLLDETLGPNHLGGMLLIALGLAAIDGRIIRRWRRVDP